MRKKIVTLILAYNAVGQQSCSSLANLLVRCSTLEHLDCHWGHMRQDGAAEFAQALTSAPKLKHLDVGWNGFGDALPCRCTFGRRGAAHQSCCVPNLEVDSPRITNPLPITHFGLSAHQPNWVIGRGFVSRVVLSTQRFGAAALARCASPPRSRTSNVFPFESICSKMFRAGMTLSRCAAKSQMR